MYLETLVIDDDATTAEYVRTLAASDEALHVSLYTDPEDALVHIQKNKVHIIVLDILMPHTDGVQLLRKIKEIDPLVHVIMMTVDTTFGRVLTSLRYGALDFLIKPLEDEDMKTVLRLSKERWERWNSVLAATSLREKVHGGEE